MEITKAHRQFGEIMKRAASSRSRNKRATLWAAEKIFISEDVVYAWFRGEIRQGKKMLTGENFKKVAILLAQAQGLTSKQELLAWAQLGDKKIGGDQKRYLEILRGAEKEIWFSALPETPVFPEPLRDLPEELQGLLAPLESALASLPLLQTQQEERLRALLDLQRLGSLSKTEEVDRKLEAVILFFGEVKNELLEIRLRDQAAQATAQQSMALLREIRDEQVNAANRKR
jgi:hypothetical protein